MSGSVSSIVDAHASSMCAMPSGIGTKEPEAVPGDERETPEAVSQGHGKAVWPLGCTFGVITPQVSG